MGACLLPLGIVSGSAPLAANASTDFCTRLGHSIEASAGAHMYCDVKTGQKPASARLKQSARTPQIKAENNQQEPAGSFGSNVNAGNPREDQTPSGLQSYGQSEVSIAATGRYVVEAWNDATAFFSPCPSDQYKEELTGLGFSSDGGQSFRDLGGLPNDCTVGQYFGDPSVETWQSGGVAYFYISSLYARRDGTSQIAMDACRATGTGAAAHLDCVGPFAIATGLFDISDPTNIRIDFLDKDFLSIDPQRARLYADYTRFGSSSATFNGQVELAACDISSPMAPRCSPGDSTAPYFVVAPSAACENEGAYPAVHLKTGDVYVAWEYNWATAVFVSNPDCQTPAQHVQNKVAHAPFACLTPPPSVSPCPGPDRTQAVDIISMQAAFVPGYNRFPMNDFPRIAVSDPAGTVSIVWNDARRVPTGDILLQSFALGTLSPSTSNPIRLNSDPNFKWKFLPALRNADANGKLNVSWYDRRGLPGALTDVWAALAVDPLTHGAPDNVKVTTEPTDWNAVSSDIIPNFGDYTDNYVIAIANSPYVNHALFVAWADGRMGLPQPFAARLNGDGENAGP